MKLLIILSVVAWSSAAKLDKTYLPPNNAQSAGGSNFLQAPSGPSDYQSARKFEQNDYTQNQYNQNTNDIGFNYNDNNAAFGNFESRPERAQAAFERNAAILRQDNANDGETFAYAYETENGIYAEENGVATNGVEAQGGYSYTGDDGQVYSVRYTAGENGFVPQGDHLPTPPPIPEDILKALEQNARDEAAGIYDDGSYSDGKYGNSEDQQQYNDFKTNTDGVYNGNNEDSVVTNSAAFSRGQNFGVPRSNGQKGVTKAYLPPFEAQRQASQPRSFDRQVARSTASNTYLPPFGNQRNSPRRQSFNARNGYQY